MSKDPSAKYYQNNKGKLQSPVINNEAFPKKKKKKHNNMGIKTSLKIQSKN